MTIETITFESTDAVRLEGRLAFPDGTPPHGGVVLCHPHPEFGGSMSSRLIPALQRAFLEAGWASLRFNFRGVGRSDGSHGQGVAEVHDVLGALARMREACGVHGPRISVVGWSFGALVGLNAVCRDRGVSSYVGIAPPVRDSLRDKLSLPPVGDTMDWEARSLIVCGSEDRLCRPDDARELARQLPPAVSVYVVDGADHVFTHHVDELCRVVVEFVAGG